MPNKQRYGRGAHTLSASMSGFAPWPWVADNLEPPLWLGPFAGLTAEQQVIRLAFTEPRQQWRISVFESGFVIDVLWVFGLSTHACSYIFNVTNPAKE